MANIRRKKVKSSITIAIPAYNEEENISLVVKDTLKKLPTYFKDFEVVVVNDGSTDKTGEILDELAQKHRSLRIVYQNNGGYSKAMWTGIKTAKKDYVAYMPADGQFMIDDMRHCFEAMDSADLILGYRGGRPDYNTKRMIFSYGYLTLLTLLFNIKYMDVGWVNIWKTKRVQKMKLTCAEGIFILTEIVIRFMKKGYKIVEAPSYYHVRKAGVVKNAKWNVVFKTFKSAFRLWLELKFF